MPKYKVGTIIKGQVTGIAKYGIFVNVGLYYNGLIHISEISSQFVHNVNDYISVGETIFAKIIEIDEENLQLKLSIKDIDYKAKNSSRRVTESPNGFTPLKDNLGRWIKEKLEEMKKKKG